MRILIVGYGFVGTATEYLFRKTKAEIHIYDTVKGSTVFCDEDMFDYIFLCVPTPSGEDGKLDISILTDAYEQWKLRGQIVIRSTIGPDQVDSFPNAIMMPEFLREKHWKEDVDDPSLPIIVSDYKTVELFNSLFFLKKRVYYLRPKESMMYKLARNSVLAMRVSMANHLQDICLECGVDWNSIAHMFEADKAIGYSHWKVPGPDGAPGFGGKCLPKDLTHMASLCYNKDNIMTTALSDNLVRRVKWGINEPSY